MLWNKERLQLHVQETLGCPAAAAAAVLLTPIKRCMDGAAARRGARGGAGAAGGGSGRRPELGPRMQEARGGGGAPRLAGLGSPPSSRGAAGLNARDRAPLRPPRPPLGSPGGVGSARGWRPENGLAAGRALPPGLSLCR